VQYPIETKQTISELSDEIRGFSSLSNSENASENFGPADIVQLEQPSKPSVQEEKSPTLFNDQRCEHQVMYLGLLENVRVRRAGFAFRMLFTRFMLRLVHCILSLDSDISLFVFVLQVQVDLLTNLAQLPWF
jgi:hypothetical protein